MAQARGQDVLSRLAGEGLDFFTIDDLVDRVGLPRDAAQDVARRLAKANQVRRLKRGLYIVLDPAYWRRPDAGFVANWYLVAARLAAPDPYYLAYYTAMELHQMLQHPLVTVFAATTEQKPTVRVGIATFRFVRVTERKFFGFEERQIERGAAVAVADLERTFLDCADRIDLCGGLEEVARAFRRRHEDLDRDRLLRYVLELGKPVATKRLGFLLETIGHGDARLMWELERLAGQIRHYAPLVPGRATADAPKNKRWELLINADLDRLLRSVEP